MLRSYDQFAGNSSEKTWLFAIAKNVAIDHFRKQAVRQKHSLDFFDWETEQLHSNTPSPEDMLEASDEFLQVESALENCTGDQKNGYHYALLSRFIDCRNSTNTRLDRSEGKNDAASCHQIFEATATTG